MIAMYKSVKFHHILLTNILILQVLFLSIYCASNLSLETVFKSFSAFRAGEESTPLMDNAEFAKFTRDLKLLDKLLTPTDVDIIFFRVTYRDE